MTDKRLVTVTICDVEQYDGDWPTDRGGLLVDAIGWFQAKLALVPKAYRATAECEIDSSSGYESSHYGHIQIKYYRPETTDEAADREARLQNEADRVRNRELSTLRALQEKYGAKP